MGHIIPIKAPTLEDTGHGIQAGDPGPALPPVNLVQAFEEPLSPIGALAADLVHARLKSGRHQSAVMELLDGFNRSTLFVHNAVGQLESEDLMGLAPICRNLVSNLKALAAGIEAKLPKVPRSN